MIIKITEVKPAKTTPIRFADLKNGDVFQYHLLANGAGWSSCIYILVNKRAQANGQCVKLGSVEEDTSTWFEANDCECEFRVFNSIELSEPIEVKERLNR